MVRRWLLRFITGLAAVAIFGSLAVVGGAKAVVSAQADHRIYGVDDVPTRDVALVLGAAVWSGRLSPYLQARLDLAIELYRAGKVRVLLASGSTDGTYNEPDAMRDYLIEQGVDAADVVTDHDGDDTYSSCYRAKHVYGVNELTVITQTYHLPRAVAACELVGIDTVGVGDDTREVNVTMRRYQIRELGANVKLMWDVLRRRSDHAGTPSDDVTVALGRPR